MGHTLNFLLCLLMATLGPVLALRYLEPILLKLLRAQCPQGGEAAEFWMRSSYVMAVCGTLLLMLSFGQYRGDTFEALERGLWLVAAGTFGAVAVISRQAWAPLRAAGPVAGPVAGAVAGAASSSASTTTQAARPAARPAVAPAGTRWD